MLSLIRALRCLFYCLLFVACPAFAASVNLAWDAPTDTTGIAGYRIGYGTQSGSYSQLFNAGNALTATVPGLNDGTTYFFAAQSYGNAPDSVYSNEVSATTSIAQPPPDTTPPVVSIASPAAGATLRGKGNVTINASATDNVGVVVMWLALDGTIVKSVNAASLSYSWNIRNVSRGQHTLAVTARDAAGNQSVKTITVTRQ